MRHDTLTLAIPPTLPDELHPDAALLALVPELEAAGRAQLAYDRDYEVTSRDPDYEEAMTKSQALSDALNDVAERVYAHRPRTIAGLLVVAHTVALHAEDTWDLPADGVGHDGTLLRYLANGLFALVGTDWRGQPAAQVKAKPPRAARPDAGREAAITRMLTKPAAEAPSRDAALLALRPILEAAERTWLSVRERYGRTHTGLPDYAEAHAAGDEALAELYEAADSVLAHEPRTLEGLVLSARAVAAQHEDVWESPHEKLDLREQALGTFITRFLGLAGGIDWRGRPLDETAAALDTAGSESAVLPLVGVADPQPTLAADPILAAIDESKAALDEHIAACSAPDAETRAGDARRDAARDAAYRAWRELLAMTPTTAAGAQALALRAVDQLERGGCWNDEDSDVDARTLFRAIAAAGPSGADSHLSTSRGAAADRGVPVAAEPGHELSALTVQNLEMLADVCRQQRDALDYVGCHWFSRAEDGSFTALGEIIETQSERFSRLADAVVDEIERRRPIGNDERNLRLATLVRHHLTCNGYIEPDLLAEVAEAWGERKAPALPMAAE